MYWRRFSVASIPVDDLRAFELWLKNVWIEKEELLEYFAQNGRFPADDGQDPQGGSSAPKGAGFIETEVRLTHWWEISQIFVFMGALALSADVLAKLWSLVVRGDFGGAHSSI